MSKKKKRGPGSHKVAPYIKTRAGLVFLVVLGLMFVLVSRIIYINRNDGKDYSKKILSQLPYASEDVYASRGNIYDRNGTVLAYNMNQYNLIIEPKNILENDPKRLNLNATLDAICAVFPEVDRQDIINIVDEKSESNYVRLLKKVDEAHMEAFEAYTENYKNQLLVPESKTEDESQAETESQAPETGESSESTGFVDQVKSFFKDFLVKDGDDDKKDEKRGKIIGTYFEPEPKRYYPYGTLAASTIGFANANGGATGIEKQYDDVLKGTNGRKYGYLNAESSVEIETVAAVDGYSVVSTIDLYIQKVCQKLIDKYQKKVGSKVTAIMVMNPRNGEIYAMASSDTYDLNNPSDYSADYSEEAWEELSQEEQSNYLLKKWRNFCVSTSYEPGSTAKVFTVAAGLEEALLADDQYFVCDGLGTYNGSKIHCHKTSGHGGLDVTGALMASCNDALMQMAVNYIKKDVFCDYQSKFNIGRYTGIDLPNEESCSAQIYTADRMYDVDLATNSFGQNYYVTMVQMCAAYSSLVNGGNYYEPHVVKEVINNDGNVIERFDPVVVRQTVSEKTCEFIKNALFQTVENGTGNLVKIDGYEIGGKTGTAEKANYQTNEKETYTVSFMAVAPAYDPEVVVYVVVDEPHVEKSQNTYQAKGLAKDALEAILPYLNIYPTADENGTHSRYNFTSEEDDELYDEEGEEEHDDLDQIREERNPVSVSGE